MLRSRSVQELADRSGQPGGTDAVLCMEPSLDRCRGNPLRTLFGWRCYGPFRAGRGHAVHRGAEWGDAGTRVIVAGCANYLADSGGIGEYTIYASLQCRGKAADIRVGYGIRSLKIQA
jgi:hypothetical protein